MERANYCSFPVIKMTYGLTLVLKENVLEQKVISHETDWWISKCTKQLDYETKKYIKNNSALEG